MFYKRLFVVITMSIFIRWYCIRGIWMRIFCCSSLSNIYNLLPFTESRRCDIRIEINPMTMLEQRQTRNSTLAIRMEKAVLLHTVNYGERKKGIRDFFVRCTEIELCVPAHARVFVFASYALYWVDVTRVQCNRLSYNRQSKCRQNCWVTVKR